jgi:hypothetical protein
MRDLIAFLTFAALLAVSVCADDRKLFVERGLLNGRSLKRKKRTKKKTTTTAPTTSCVLDLKPNTTDYSSEELSWIQSNAVLLNENSTVLYAEPNVETGSLCTCCLNDKCATGQSCEATLGVIIAVVIIVFICCVIGGAICYKQKERARLQGGAQRQVYPQAQMVAQPVAYPPGTLMVPAQNEMAQGQPGTVMMTPIQQPGTVMMTPVQQPGTVMMVPGQQPGTVMMVPGQQPGTVMMVPGQRQQVVQKRSEEFWKVT